MLWVNSSAGTGELGQVFAKHHKVPNIAFCSNHALIQGGLYGFQTYGAEDESRESAVHA